MKVNHGHSLSRLCSPGNSVYQRLLRAGWRAGGLWGLGGVTRRDSRLCLFVKHTRDRDPIEILHLRKGGSQDLGRAHGGHVAARLG